MAKVARLYYEKGLRQTEIVKRLDLSQPTISRLLRRAQAEKIVRITVNPPPGAHTNLEESLESAFGLKEAIVVDVSADNDEEITRELGAAAAFHLETTLKPNEVIGISSWSAALLSMVDAMRPMPRLSGLRVVQILGGVGNPGAEAHATQLTNRLAALVNGEAVLLPAPGVVGSAGARRVLQRDRFVRETMGLFKSVTLALAGIGEVEPSRLLAESGNVFSAAELRRLKRQGAAGDVCLRFFNDRGEPVGGPLNERVIGMELEQLRRVRRSAGIAGGRRKLHAIRAALAGGWVNVLITDRFTAQRLLKRKAAA